MGLASRGRRPGEGVLLTLPLSKYPSEELNRLRPSKELGQLLLRCSGRFNLLDRRQRERAAAGHAERGARRIGEPTPPTSHGRPRHRPVRLSPVVRDTVPGVQGTNHVLPAQVDVVLSHPAAGDPPGYPLEY